MVSQCLLPAVLSLQREICAGHDCTYEQDTVYTKHVAGKALNLVWVGWELELVVLVVAPADVALFSEVYKQV